MAEVDNEMALKYHKLSVNNVGLGFAYKTAVKKLKYVQSIPTITHGVGWVEKWAFGDCKRAIKGTRTHPGLRNRARLFPLKSRKKPMSDLINVHK